MAPAAPQKKVKKSQETINSKLALAIKSGKYTIGYKTTLKSIRSGKGMSLKSIKKENEDTHQTCSDIYNIFDDNLYCQFI